MDECAAPQAVIVLVAGWHSPETLMDGDCLSRIQFFDIINCLPIPMVGKTQTLDGYWHQIRPELCYLSASRNDVDTASAALLIGSAAR
jgi:hypothetical protein